MRGQSVRGAAQVQGSLSRESACGGRLSERTRLDVSAAGFERISSLLVSVPCGSVTVTRLALIGEDQSGGIAFQSSS